MTASLARPPTAEEEFIPLLLDDSDNDSHAAFYKDDSPLTELPMNPALNIEAVKDDIYQNCGNQDGCRRTHHVSRAVKLQC